MSAMSRRLTWNAPEQARPLAQGEQAAPVDERHRWMLADNGRGALLPQMQLMIAGVPCR